MEVGGTCDGTEGTEITVMLPAPLLNAFVASPMSYSAAEIVRCRWCEYPMNDVPLRSD